MPLIGVVIVLIIAGIAIFVFFAIIYLLVARSQLAKQIKWLRNDITRLKAEVFLPRKPEEAEKPVEEAKKVEPVPVEEEKEAVPKAAEPAAAEPARVSPPEPVVPPIVIPEPTKPEKIEKPPRAKINWETVIGEQLFPKLGVIVLVIGIALFLGYSWDKLGAAGKVGISLGSGIVALAIGVFLARQDKYKIFGTGLICAGWAILYFTAYAMHHIQAACVIKSPVLGGIMLGLVALGMITHTLLYHSQAFTTLAFALGYVAILLSELGVHSLVASLVLAISIVVIAYRAKWYYFLLVGLGLTYLIHFVWLGKSIQIFGIDSLLTADFYTATGFLILAWLIYKMPDFLMKPVKPPGEILSSHHLMTIGNLGAFIGLSLLQIYKWLPSYNWLFFLEAGMAYLGFAIILRSLRKEGLYLFDGAVATVLIALAIGFKLTDKWMTLGWLVEVELVIMAGILLREQIFRHLGTLLLLIPFIRLISIDIPEAGTMSLGQYSFSDAVPLVVLFTVLCYADALALYKAFLIKLTAFYERHIYRLYGYLGATLLVIALYLGLTKLAIAVGLGLAIILLIELGLKVESPDLRLQGYLISIVTIVQLFLSNFSAEEVIWGISYRIITVSLIALFFLYLFQRLLLYKPAEQNPR